MQITQEHRQKQIAMPQTIQSRQLLTLPLISLQSFLSKRILDNPYLEPTEGIGDHILLYGISPDAGYPFQSDGQTGRSGTELPLRKDLLHTDEISLTDALSLQIEKLSLPPDERRLLHRLISTVDEDGYLRESDEELAEFLMCSPDVISGLRRILQSLEPRGVGARCLSECLMLQADSTNRDYDLICRIIREDLPLLAQCHYQKLSDKYKVSMARIKAIRAAIRSMDPSPGCAFSGPSRTPYIFPDAQVVRHGPHLELRLRGSPQTLLHYDPHYMRDVKDREAAKFLREKQIEAVSLLHSIEMRYRAIQRLLEYLLVKQHDFFLFGPSRLRPLTMKSAAQDISVSPSTISRCAQDKYIDTPWGIFPLRYFFPTPSGNEDTSPQQISHKIAVWIEEEDADAPLSDETISNRLQSIGLYVSRRTVSKYREQLGIRGQRERKRSKHEKEGST